MRLKYIMLVVILASCATAFAQSPSRVRLKESVDVAILTDGKTYGAVTLQVGTTLTVRSVKDDNLMLEYRGSLITVPSSKTDYGDQMAVLKAQEAKKQQEVEVVRLAAEKKIQEQEAKKPQIAYEQMKKTVIRMRKNISSYIDSDVETAETLITDGEKFIKAYEAGDEKTRLAAYVVSTQTWIRVFETKHVYGYRYNEIVKKEISVPITFNIYKDSDAFYIQVGDGTFCTVASLSQKALVKLIDQLQKINEWAQKCIEEEMDVEKAAGSFDGVTLEFVSKNKAEHIFVWLTARGSFADDRLIEKQTVRVNMLNLTALMWRISKASELYDQREKVKNNANKLK